MHMHAVSSWHSHSLPRDLINDQLLFNAIHMYDLYTWELLGNFGCSEICSYTDIHKWYIYMKVRSWRIEDWPIQYKVRLQDRNNLIGLAIVSIGYHII